SSAAALIFPQRSEESAFITPGNMLVSAWVAPTSGPVPPWPVVAIRYAVGAISPNTIELLLQAGYVYFGNGLADDIPHYWVSDFASRRALLTLPYYYHFDDQFFLMFPRKGTGLEHPDALLRNWRGEFAAQYRRGRYFHMTLHPQHIGWSNRLQMLDEFLAELRWYPGLWNPTGSECARYWLETYPASEHLHL